MDPTDNFALICTITRAESSDSHTRPSPSENIVDVLMIGCTTTVFHFFPAASIVSRRITLSVIGLLAGLKWRGISTVELSSSGCERA